MNPSKDQILERLRRVKGPDMEGNIVDLGLVSEILLKDGRVSFSITVPAERADELEPLRQAAEKVVREIEGVERRGRGADGGEAGGASGGGNGAGRAAAGAGKRQGAAGARRRHGRRRHAAPAPPAAAGAGRGHVACRSPASST